MPVITFESGTLTKSVKEKLIQNLTDISAEITGISKDLFFISIKEIPDEGIAVGGVTVRELKERFNAAKKVPKVQNSTIDDIDEIFRLYEIATEFQKTKECVVWPTFEPSLVKTEISENRQWKLINDNQIACIWATTFDDPQIWEEKNEEPALYIHRIATNPEFRGHKLVAEIVEWAKKYAIEHNKRFIRMDTVGENKKLVSYYESCGFRYLGLSQLKNTSELPAHYHNATVSLFEIHLS